MQGIAQTGEDIVSPLRVAVVLHGKRAKGPAHTVRAQVAGHDRGILEPVLCAGAHALVRAQQQAHVITDAAGEETLNAHALLGRGLLDPLRLDAADRLDGVGVEQVEIELRHGEPQIMPDDPQPFFRLGPALHGKIIVDAQDELRHFRPPL